MSNYSMIKQFKNASVLNVNLIRCPLRCFVSHRKVKLYFGERTAGRADSACALLSKKRESVRFEEQACDLKSSLISPWAVFQHVYSLIKHGENVVSCD